MDVRHGALLRVFGDPVRRGGYVFMLAEVELDGGSFTPDFPLRDHAGDPPPASLLAAVEHGFDAAWVRARIPRVFGINPPTAEVEKALIEIGVVAAVEGGETCYPFVCSDYYGKSALLFSGEGPSAAAKQAIASAFWGVLLADPDDLADFEGRVYHIGAFVWLRYGCDAGRVYLCDDSDE
jgi:hypothetical protein